MIRITIWNNQGASEVKHVDDKDEAIAYLNSWTDPENLQVTVVKIGEEPWDQEEIGTKRIGETEIEWK